MNKPSETLPKMACPSAHKSTYTYCNSVSCPVHGPVIQKLDAHFAATAPTGITL